MFQFSPFLLNSQQQKWNFAFISKQTGKEKTAHQLIEKPTLLAFPVITWLQ